MFDEELSTNKTLSMYGQNTLLISSQFKQSSNFFGLIRFMVHYLRYNCGFRKSLVVLELIYKTSITISDQECLCFEHLDII